MAHSASHAYEHYLVYLATKTPPLALTFTDLIYVANFKGGSATVAEPVGTLAVKLAHYSDRLQLFARDPASRLSLGAVPDADYPRIRAAMVAFAALPESPETDISGLGSSFASALLHFHFPRLVPILDRRALSGSVLGGLTVSAYGQVTNALQLYPALTDYCHQRLRLAPAMTLRELERALRQTAEDTAVPGTEVEEQIILMAAGTWQAWA